jgi:ABC-type multidrug transport system fused ATPase/permease subunit
MKPIWRFLKKYKLECVMAPFFKLLEACFDLLVPIVVKSIMDVGIKNRDTSYVLYGCLILVALGIIGLLCAIVAQYFAARAAARTGTLMRSDLFRHCTALSYTQMDQTGISTLIQRMTGDINQVQTGGNMFLRLFLRSPFVVAGAMVMAFSVNTKAALIFVAVIAALFAVVGLLTKLTMPLYKQNQSRLDAVLRAGREHLTGVRVVRAFAREEEERDSFAQKGEVLFAGQRKERKKG